MISLVSSPARLRHCKAALTVTELLAVMAIVAVLLVLLFATLGNTMEGARSAKCVGNLKQLVAGLTAYASDHNMKLPPAGSWPLGRLPKWYQVLNPYVGGPAPTGPYMGTMPTEKILGRDFLKCPSAKMPTKESEFVSYGINYRYIFFVEALDPTNAAQMKTYHGSMRLSQVPRNAFLLGDSGIPGAGSQGTIHSPYWWTFDRDEDKDGKADSNGAIGGGPYNWFAPRHNHSGNMAFADGSVRNLTGRQWVANDGGVWGPDSQNP